MMISTALSMPQMQQQCLEKGREYILRAINEVRTLSHAMVTPHFNEKPLTLVLSEMAETLEMAGNLSTVVDVENEAAVNGLPDKLKLAIYRITQEQVSNILKYAKAKEISIVLKKQAGKLVLSLSDNGCGFDPKRQARGIGLKNIASRVALLNGTMDIISAPGKGCMIKVEVPV